MRKHNRKIVSVLAIVLILTMIIGTIAPFAQVIFGASINQSTTVTNTATEETGAKTPVSSVINNNNFEVSVEIGFDGVYIVEKETPIKIKIKNNGNDFQGEVSMKVYTQIKNEDMGETGRYVIYYQDIDLASGAVKEYSLDSAISTVNSTIEIEITDKKDEVVYRNNFPVTALSPDTIATAVITDNASGMDYIKSLNLYDDVIVDYTTSEQIFLFTKDNFPKTKSILDNFKNIVISDFDTKSLSTEQINAIYEWLESGGNIVIGTGQNEMRSLSAFSENFGITATNPTSKNFNTYSELTGMYTCDILGEGLQTVVEDNGNPLFLHKTYGGGNIIIATFDMALAPFSGYIKSSEIIKTAFDNSGITFEGGTEYFQDNNYINVDAAKKVPLKDNGSLNIIFIIVIVYIIVIGPILYFILKKKDKRELGWIAIPVISIIFTLVIFVIGKTSFYNNNILGVTSIVEMKNGTSYGNAQIAVNAKSPDAGSVSVKLSENIPIKIIDDRYYRYSDEDVCMGKINVGENKKISFFETEKWSDNYFMTEKNINMGGEFKLDAELIGDTIKLYIKNNTTHNFENAIVVIGNFSVQIGDISAQTEFEKDININDQSNYKVSSYMGGYELYFGVEDGYKELKDRFNSNQYNKDDIFTDSVRSSLIENAFNDATIRNIEIDNTGMIVSLYLFDSDDIIKEGSLVNGKIPSTIVNNIYYVDTVIKYEDMESYEIPEGIVMPIILDDEIKGQVDYSTERDYIYAYSENSNDIVEVPMIFDVQNISGLKSFKISSYNDSNIKEEIFNVKTQNYETLKSEEITDIYSYIDENGKIRIRIHYPCNDDQRTMPKITIKGGSK